MYIITSISQKSQTGRNKQESNNSLNNKKDKHFTTEQCVSGFEKKMEMERQGIQNK